VVVAAGPATPYGRALVHPRLCKAIKRRQRATYRNLDPVALLAEVRGCQEELGERIGKRGLAAATASATGMARLSHVAHQPNTCSTGHIDQLQWGLLLQPQLGVELSSPLAPHGSIRR
jgi:hypothetical protein